MSKFNPLLSLGRATVFWWPSSLAEWSMRRSRFFLTLHLGRLEISWMRK